MARSTNVTNSLFGPLPSMYCKNYFFAMQVFYFALAAFVFVSAGMLYLKPRAFGRQTIVTGGLVALVTSYTLMYFQSRLLYGMCPA